MKKNNKATREEQSPQSVGQKLANDNMPLFIEWVTFWHGNCSPACDIKESLNSYEQEEISFENFLESVKETDDGWEESFEHYVNEKQPKQVGHTPGELTLLVTGSGKRIDEAENELLLRTDDATLHFQKHSEFGKLAHALVDAYNAQPDLLEALTLAEVRLSVLIDQNSPKKYEGDKKILSKIQAAINKATKQ